ncbi:5-methyltetrahydrofolate--homocysteine methyltransferase [Arsukibacterium sp.]|uniref:5-methyltetrahydrofolate--homocysteine methyltransferase n=1 Tax=Arsukibacterium sp. TaxID=1977258 RepID=UPI002FDA7C15
MMKLQTKIAYLAIAMSAAFLTGCGDTTVNINELPPIVGDDDDHDHDHDHDGVNAAGRLVLSAIDNAFIQVLELPAKTELNTFVVTATPSAVVASGDHRYAAIVQRNQDLVQFIDGGLWQEDHVEHMHDYQEAPRLMPFQLTQVRPTHFTSAEGQLAVFFDGNATTGAAAGVAVLTDADIGEDRSDYPQLTLTTHQHGAAQARGDYLISTLRDANSSTTLPDQVALYHQHGDHFDLEEVFAVNCPNLHGSAQNHDFIAFGCTDGVLLIEQSGETFTASKLENTTDFSGSMRIGTLAGHDAAEHFIGLAGSAVFAIHAEDAEMELLDWQPGEATAIWGYGFAEQGEKFVLLDNTGALTIFNYHGHAHGDEEAFEFAAKLVMTEAELAAMPAGARFQLAISAADDKVYVTDPIAKQLITVDLHDAEVVNTKQLNFTPHRITWLGIANPSDDHHDH